MKRWKRGLAALLATVLLISLLPMTVLAAELSPAGSTKSEESGIMPTSLLPIKEYRIYPSLKGYFPDQLKKFKLSELIEIIKEENSTIKTALDSITIEAIAYSVGIGSDDYQVVNLQEDDPVIDLSPRYNGSMSSYVNLIIGSADQLDPNNIRITIGAYILLTEDYLKVDIANENRETINIADVYTGGTDRNGHSLLNVEISAEEDFINNYYISLKFNDTLEELNSEDYNVSVYKGYYEDTIPAEAEEITSQIWETDPTASGYLAVNSKTIMDLPEVTVAISDKNGEIVQITPLAIRIINSIPSISFSRITEINSTEDLLYSYTRIKGNTEETSLEATLDYGYNPEETYQIKLRLFDNDLKEFEIKHVVLGNCTAEEIQDLIKENSENDLNETLFGPGVGYAADYSKGVTFSILFTNNRVYKLTIKTLKLEKIEERDRPNTEDPYFRMETASSKSGSEFGSTKYNYWAMPTDVDGYYYGYASSNINYGVQTLFLLNNEKEAVSETEIVPGFWSMPGVTIYASHDNESASKQITEESKVSFSAKGIPEAIPYSASAGETKLKNYWVTFLTQQEGPKLFVNGMNIPSIQDEEGNPIREIYLDQAHGGYHDIFFANIGDKALENITITLDDTAKKCVTIDEYWGVNSSHNSLAAFTTTATNAPDGSQTSYGMLPNVGKIRLKPALDAEGNPKAATIAGTLTIQGDGEDNCVTIKLSGEIGDYRITTQTIHFGVKYVPYEQLIQTNILGQSEAVNFNITGLPAGLSHQGNGVIYGIPMVSGTFPVTVTARFANGKTDERQYELLIKDNIIDNGDTNVWTYDEVIWGNQSYMLSIAIPNDDYTVSAPGGRANISDNNWDETTMVFQSEGEFGTFIHHVYLDGIQLTEGTDYTSDEGSTKITIQTQVLKNRGNGTHTIAAEFRSAGQGQGNLRTAQQNYTLKTKGTSSSTGGGGSGGGSYTPSSPSTPSNPPTPESYGITLNNSPDNGGAVASNVNTAKKGDTVTITVTPDSGYETGSVIVKDANGKDIPLTKTGENQYTFVMPEGKVEVSATFNEILPDPNVGLPFIDVRTEDWFTPYVQKVYKWNLMIGTSEKTFSPTDNTLRGMILTILYRLAGSPATGSGMFTDVSDGMYYSDAINWAAEQNIIAGYGDGTFGPDDSLSRDQLVMILMAYAKYCGLDVTKRADLSVFSDMADIPEYSFDALSWAVAEGLVTGKDNGLLDPKGTATRSEMAALLVRYCEMIESTEEKKS